MIDIFEENYHVIEKVLASKIHKVQTLSSRNNSVYLVETENEEFVAKFYTTQGLHADNELLFNKKINENASKYLKEIVAVDDSITNATRPYAIFKHIEGRTLKDILEEKDVDSYDMHKIALQINDFLEYSWQIKSEKFGYLCGSLVASHDTLREFIYDYQKPTINSLVKNPMTAKFAEYPYNILNYAFENMDTHEQCVAPIDLNMTNIIVSPKNQVKIVDPGSIISANPLSSLGELTAHTYGTQLFYEICELRDFDEQTIYSIRCFAALSNLNVLAFIARSGMANITQAKPFGNPNTFFSLIEEHYMSAMRGKK